MQLGLKASQAGLGILDLQVSVVLAAEEAKQLLLDSYCLVEFAGAVEGDREGIEMARDFPGAPLDGQPCSRERRLEVALSSGLDQEPCEGVRQLRRGGIRSRMFFEDESDLIGLAGNLGYVLDHVLKILPGVMAVGIDLQSSRECSDSFIEMSLVCEECPQIVPGVMESRIKSNRAPEGGGGVGLALFGQRPPEIVPGLRAQQGVDEEGPLKGIDSVIKAALLSERDTEVVPDLRVFLLDVDGLPLGI